MLLDEAENVRLADAAAKSSAGNLAKINIVFTRHAADQR